MTEEGDSVLRNAGKAQSESSGSCDRATGQGDSKEMGLQQRGLKSRLGE